MTPYLLNSGRAHLWGRFIRSVCQSALLMTFVLQDGIARGMVPPPDTDFVLLPPGRPQTMAHQQMTPGVSPAGRVPVSTASWGMPVFSQAQQAASPEPPPVQSVSPATAHPSESMIYESDGLHPELWTSDSGCSVCGDGGSPGMDPFFMQGFAMPGDYANGDFMANGDVLAGGVFPGSVAAGYPLPMDSCDAGCGSCGESPALTWQPMYGVPGPPFSAPFGPQLPMNPAGPFSNDYDAFSGDVCGCDVWCPCGDVRRWWLEGSALIWWSTPSKSPALATTSDPAVPQQNAGILGLPTTQVLFGDNKMLNDSTSGFRMRQGHWFDQCGIWGFDSEYLVFGKSSDELTVASDAFPVIARPFTNALPVLPGTPDSVLTAYPGLNTGSLDMELGSRLQSAAIHLRRTLIQTCRPGESRTGRGQRNFTAGLQAGPRFVGLREKLTISEESDSLANGEHFSIYDGFRTKNRFFGCELGVFASSQRRRFSLDSGVRLAVGQLQQELNVTGQTTTTDINGNVTVLPGGILAQRTNMRSADKTRLGFVPQLDVSLGYKLTDTWKFSVGYNLLYINRVLRATEQVDSTLNPNLLPPEMVPFDGPLRPQGMWNESDYLAHGISLGLEKRW